MTFCNVLSLIFLATAIYFAKKKQITRHKVFIALSLLSSLVLVYLFVDIRITGKSVYSMDGWSVYLKLFLLIHILAATVSFFYSFYVAYLGLNASRFSIRHKKNAYRLLPIWILSSLSGISLYFLA